MIAAILGLATGCLDAGPPPHGIPDPSQTAGAPAPPPIDEVETSGQFEAELGVSDPITQLEFMPLAAGDAIPIAGSGQAGLTARLAVRIRALGEQAVPADVLLDVQLTGVVSGLSALNSTGIPTRLKCDDDGSCYRMPLHVEVSHLAPEDEHDGLLVEGRLTVRDADDPERVLAVAECSGQLERY